MKKIVEFPTENGASMLVEIEDSEKGGLVKASRSDAVIVKAQQSLEKSLEKVKPAAQFIILQLRKLHDAPSEIQVTFGLKLSADAGAVLASAGAEANYTVTLKWEKKNTAKTSNRKKKIS